LQIKIVVIAQVSPAGIPEDVGPGKYVYPEVTI
jgi:hypothetical protein